MCCPSTVCIIPVCYTYSSISVESVIPEVVSEHEIGVGKKAGTGETLKSVDYSRLTAVLIEAVKELKTQNEALETRIAALESN
jgi:hypothetical protein